MILAAYIWIIGSLVIGILGTMHLIYTFFTDKFLPRNSKLKEEMSNTNPVLTKAVSMWSGCIGFNASHSTGIVFISIINVWLAIERFPFLQKSHFFFLFNMLTIGFYVWLAKRYWFKIPLMGATITLTCYTLSYILTIISR